MDNIQKASNLFNYIRELYALKIKVISDIRKQEWFKFTYDIPDDSENIHFNFMDTVDETLESDFESAVILEIKKPEYEDGPIMPAILEGWVIGDYYNFKKTIECLEMRTFNSENNKGNAEEEYFTDDKKRAEAFKQWNKLRETWVSRQLVLEQTRELFNSLYYLYIDLARDSEIIEFMVGQGVLSCEMGDGSRAFHPLLLKRVTLNFDSQNNIMRVLDTSSNPEIYTMLLQEIEYINHSAVKELRDELSENFYHPLDRKLTPEFLTKFAHLLHSDSSYENFSLNPKNKSDKITIYNNPVFFVRKRIGGVIKALDEIIEQILSTGELSGPLLNLLGENLSQYVDDLDQGDISQIIANISGEDRDILLTKEANKEQLEIAKRIENYNAVLVQGPPGTGKTHTIANLMGHFLAQGKSVLVTSHTKKALSVVKEKVSEELRDLCVSVLDDNNKDMERSIDGITEYISTHTSFELAESIEELKSRREKLILDLGDVRKRIYSIKYKEYESIVFGGVGYSAAEVAKFVCDNQDELSYLPGKVVLNKPLPVSISDLELLYKTNELISIADENELKLNLPDPKELLSPLAFEDVILRKNENIKKITTLVKKLGERVYSDISKNTVCIDSEPLCENFNLENADNLNIILNNKRNTKFLNWEYTAILAGKNGGGFRKTWENLIDIIKDTYKYAGDIAPEVIGKNPNIPFSAINESTLKILEEMRSHLESGKKFDAFTLLFHKDWKEILRNIKIDGEDIQSVDNINTVIYTMILKLKRVKLELLWSELISKNRGVIFADFGSDPEQACNSYVGVIEEHLNWYNEQCEKLIEMFLACGFNKLCVKPASQFTSPLQEIEYLIDLMYRLFPIYIELADIIYIQQVEINESLNSLKNLLDKEKFESAICKNILYSIESENISEYKKNYDELSELYQKYHYLSERERILNSISEYAPEWANLIQNRIGIFSHSEVPKNIEAAWKWKQFSGIIDDITSLPFESLQHQANVLNSSLRSVTLQLAKNMAWYHLICRIENDISQKQALQGWKLTTKKIGKGTGKGAPKLKREAQKLMAQCQRAVPAWIMTLNNALENLDPSKNKFDIVIIDESSQSDISALAIMYLAKKIIIVGDDEQVSPSAVGVDTDKMSNLVDMHIKGIIPNSHLYDMKTSVYDIAKTTFPSLMLREHFRCVPSIIGYSNRLSYDYKIKPLRDAGNVSVKPATVAFRVNGQRDGKKQNIEEAHNIIALMLACMEQPEYNNMTFGAISLLGDEQAKLINRLAIDKISPIDFEKRRILCGNASQFQGDERDIVFISLVDSNEGDGPLRMTGEGVEKSTKQRYNVAASRARNQLWVVHSLDIANDLKQGDMRKDLIEYVSEPNSFEERDKQIISKSESVFEISVARELVKRGYNIVQQWHVGSYRIDMVAICKDKKVAIECDGELYHSGDDNVRYDMERQAILERLGWRFIRIRGSEYYRNPNNAIKRVIDELSNYDIEPENKHIESAELQLKIALDDQNISNELLQRVIQSALKILDSWKNNE